MHQASYGDICEVLRGVLVEGVQAGPGPGGIGSVRCRVSGAMYALLMAHPIDRQGRCRSCRRRPGAMFGVTHQRCRVHREMRYWLHQPEPFLHAWVAQEWGLIDTSLTATPDRANAACAADPDVTDVLPRITPEPDDSPVSMRGGTGVHTPTTPGPAMFHPANPSSLLGSLIHCAGMPRHSGENR